MARFPAFPAILVSKSWVVNVLSSSGSSLLFLFSLLLNDILKLLNLLLLLLLHFDLHVSHLFFDQVCFLFVILGYFSLENIRADCAESFDVALNLLNRLNGSLLQGIRLHHNGLGKRFLNRIKLFVDFWDLSTLLATTVSLVVDNGLLGLILAELEHVFEGLNDLISAIVGG